MSASDDPSLGMIVSVSFGGDVARYLGQAGVADGLVALELAPGTTSAVAIVDGAGGFTRSTFTRGARRRGSLELLGTERVLSSSAAATVVRQGSHILFSLPALALPRSVKLLVKVYVRGFAAVRQRVGQIGSPTALALTGALPPRATDTASASLLSGAASETQLAALARTLSREVAGLTLERTREQIAMRQLEPALAGGLKADRSRRVPHPGTSRRTLVRDEKASVSGVAQLTTRLTGLTGLANQAAELLAAVRAPTVAVTQTDARLGQAMSPEPKLPMSSLRPADEPIIGIDPTVRYQRFAGIGAAMTDSAAWLIGYQLPPATRQALLQSLFGAPGQPNGLGLPDLGLDFLRVPIGASGAMTTGAPYSYDDSGDPDPALKDFSVTHDLSYMIPVLQQALAVNPALSLLATPWSPPAWMKSNDSLDDPDGHGTLLPSAYPSLAQYIVRYLQAYQAAGVPIGAITPQNEPRPDGFGTPYPGLTLPESDEAQFITQDLQPALAAAGLTTRVYGSDLSWDSLTYADGLIGTGVNGIAWHCYFGSPTVMSQLAAAAPGLDQIVDECSPEIRPFGTPEFLISSLRNWASTVAVWTVALDPDGGPIQVPNDCGGCTGPVTIDEATKAVTARPEYYQLGQVSAFVAPGAYRVASDTQVTYGVNAADVETASAGLDDVAFLNPDGSEVLVADNNSAQKLTFAVDAAGSYFSATLPAGAMTTFSWRPATAVPYAALALTRR